MHTHPDTLLALFLPRFAFLAVVAVVALASCASVSANTRAASRETTPATVAEAPATLDAPLDLPVTAPPDANAVTVARCDDDRDRCLRDALPVLTSALPRAGVAPDAEVIASLRASRSPAALVWAAYMLHHAGEESEARRVLAALEAAGERATLVEGGESDTATLALSLAREHAELLSGGAPDVIEVLPCAVFRWDAGVARRAFGPVHGSNRDAIVATFKSRCVHEALSQSMPEAQRAEARRAEEGVARTLFQQWPVPTEGTIWTANAIAARETVRDTLLLVPLDPEIEGEARARALIVRLDDADRRRLMAYRGRTEGSAWGLARAVCAVARARGEAISAWQCEMRARAAVLAAFTSWVGALRQE